MEMLKLKNLLYVCHRIETNMAQPWVADSSNKLVLVNPKMLPYKWNFIPVEWKE